MDTRGGIKNLPLGSIIDGYLVRAFLRIFFSSLLVTTSLYIVVDFFDRITNFLDNAIPVWTVIRYFVYNAPLSISRVIGFATLFSTLFCLGMAARTNEITAMRSSGISVQRIALPLLILSMFICLSTFFWNEALVPIFAHRAQAIYKVEIQKKQQQSLFGTREIWLRAQGSFINIGNFDTRTNVLEHVTVFLLNRDFSLRGLVEVPSARWNGHEWEAKEATGWNILADGKLVRRKDTGLPTISNTHDDRIFLLYNRRIKVVRGIKATQNFPMIDQSNISQSIASQNRVSGIGERSWFWLVCLVWLVIVFSNLGSSALFDPDEGRNAEKAREILLLDDWVTPYENFLPALDKPVFFYWLVAISFKLFGLSEWSARLPSALAGLGCIFLVYRFARLQWGLQEGLWSSLVLITSLEFFLFSRIVIFDMTLTFFISLSLFSFYAVTQTDNPRAGKRHCLLMYTAMGAGTLVKGPIALVIPGAVIFFYLLLTGKWFLLRRLNIPLGAIVCFAVVAPWYLWVEARNPGYLRSFLWEEHFVRYLTPHFSRTKGWYYFFLVLGIGFLPWSFFIPVTAKNLWNRTFTGANLFLTLWVILPFAFFSASNAKLPHYILPIYPALAILTGQAVAAKMQDTKRSRILYIPGIFIVTFIVYLLVGSAWPNLLAGGMRSDVPQAVSLRVL